MKLCLGFLFVTVCMLPATYGYSQTGKGLPNQTGWANDFENDLELATVASLNKTLEAHYTKTGNKFVVVTTPDAKPYDNFYDYTEQIAKAWQVGGKEDKTGVTLVVSLNSGEVKVYCGSSLKAKLTGEVVKRIVNDKMIAKFKEGNPDQGVADGVAEIIKVIEG